MGNVGQADIIVQGLVTVEMREAQLAAAFPRFANNGDKTSPVLFVARMWVATCYNPLPSGMRNLQRHRRFICSSHAYRNAVSYDVLVRGQISQHGIRDPWVSNGKKWLASSGLDSTCANESHLRTQSISRNSFGRRSLGAVALRSAFSSCVAVLERPQ